MKRIAFRDNPEFKRLRLLLDSSRVRRSEALSVLEGAHLVRAALDAGRSLPAVYVADCKWDKEIETLLSSLPEGSLRLLDRSLFGALSSADPVHGVLAHIAIESPQTEPDPGHDWLVLDGVQDS